MAEENKVFRVGIAMAGAVSAGAYTAGVMDYLLETLHKWDEQKRVIRQKIADNQNLTEAERSVPLHDVIIDVMGGASAGGMTAAITSMALFEGITPYQDHFRGKASVTENKIYDAWVNLADEEQKPTLYQMFDDEDINTHKYVQSILNSKPIDKIADRAGQGSFGNSLPPYINPNLEVILTITSLRGIPLSINFFDEDIPKLEENLIKLNQELEKVERQIAGEPEPIAPVGYAERGASAAVVEEIDLEEQRAYIEKATEEVVLDEQEEAPDQEKIDQTLKDSKAVLEASEKLRSDYNTSTRGSRSADQPDLAALEQSKQKLEDQIKAITILIAKKREANKDQPAHQMHLHKGVAHFRVNADEADHSKKYVHTFPFHPNVDWQRKLMMDSAKATGAFPIGLRSRDFNDTPTDYLKAQILRNFDANISSYDQQAMRNVLSVKLDKDKGFDFVAVDGGTVNNEPFGEVIRVMEDACGEDEENYAIIMIDPFPNFGEDVTYEAPRTLKDLIPSLIGAIRAQALLKEGDILRGLSKDHTRKMVFPSRKDEDGNKMKYPIACGALDGFGGFFSKDFREHDFQLGRKNCQSFLRKHFTIPEQKAHRLAAFKDWTGDQQGRYRIEKKDQVEEITKFVYTIIPDMDHKVPGLKVQKEELVPFDWPTISPERIFELNEPLQARLAYVLEHVLADVPEDTTRTEEQEEENKHVVDLWMEERYPETWVDRLKFRIVSSVWRKYGASGLAGIGSKEVIRFVLKDFHKRQLLDKEFVQD